jgi:cell wall-associated NlpC family hydrolase
MRVHGVIADAAERAQEEASQALDEAQQARLDAQEALDEVESTREAAIQRLSELRNVSVELERERQEGLARERQEQQRDEFENTQSDPSSSDGGSGGSGSSGGSSGSSDSGSGGNDSGGSDSGGSGSSGGETSGSWSTTAAQGQTAVDRAMSRLGATYNLGGTGPTYDCSGLTMTSWAAAGVSIPRTSRGQYSGTTQVPFSQRRPGDLLFWGTNRDSSRIYHVAMYIGNGQIVEASNYGIPVRVRDYDAYSMDKLLPTVGRP